MKGASMFGFIWWLMIGLVAGGLARLLLPGQQSMGVFVTMILGLVGSVVGGLISSVIYGYSPADSGFRASGLIMSTIGAVIALGVYVAFTRRTAT